MKLDFDPQVFMQQARRAIRAPLRLPTKARTQVDARRC